MRLPIVIVEMLQRKSGNDLCLPSDCEFLSLDIESKIGVHLGATTLKRLLGFAKDERAPHASTLEVIAQYLGFPHWEQVLDEADNWNSCFDRPKHILRSADLDAGDEVRISYKPDRMVTFRYVGDNWYEVVKIENDKLVEGDRLCILAFELHRSFYASEVIRDGESLGTYTAAISTGIRHLELIRYTSFEQFRTGEAFFRFYGKLKK